jgi:Ca2+-binding EF-hand superfamily protein
MTRIFDKADTNADGYIDRDEFAKMMEQLGNGGNLKEKLKQKLKDKFNKNVPDPSE